MYQVGFELNCILKTHLLRTCHYLSPEGGGALSEDFLGDCIIQQKGNENTQTYQGEVVILILHQILVTNFQRNV